MLRSKNIKFLSLMIFLIFFTVSLNINPVVAADELIFDVDPEKIVEEINNFADYEFSLPVKITQLPSGIAGDTYIKFFTLYVNYDNTKFEIVKFDRGEESLLGIADNLTSNFLLDPTVAKTQSFVSLQYSAMTEGIQQTGVIATLGFKIRQEAKLSATEEFTLTVKSTTPKGDPKDTKNVVYSEANSNLILNSKTVSVLSPVQTITVTGQGGADSVAKGGTLQMVAEVLPENATDKSVTWSVENETGSATIDANGLLTADKIGTVKVTATAQDSSGVFGSATITITDLPLSDGLTEPFFELSAGNGTVTPERAQNTTQYQTEVDYTVDTITVTPTAAVGTIKVNGNVVASGVASGAINLNVGANPITITVQEDGKAAKTYTITVTRLAANANANLNGLTVGGSPVADFDSAVLTYNVKLPFGTTNVPTVVGETEDANATVQVTPATNLSGTEAERTTTVTVTAQDGTTKKTYKVIFEVAKQFTVTANKTTVGNRQHVTVNVANAGVATSATIILALYDTSTANVNDMKALIFKEGPIAGGNNPGILTGGFIVPTNYTIKAFVWDDFNSQKALSDVAIP